jgi:hypothetical protein
MSGLTTKQKAMAMPRARVTAIPPLSSRRPPRVYRNKIVVKKQRFLEDTTPVRLGRLASHLSSVRSYAIFQGNRYAAWLVEETTATWERVA